MSTVLKFPQREPWRDPGFAWADENLIADPADCTGQAGLAALADAIGRNLAKHSAWRIAVHITALPWPGGKDPYKHTLTVAQCIENRGKVRAIPFVMEMGLDDRALFLNRMARAMGDATRGLESQL